MSSKEPDKKRSEVFSEIIEKIRDGGEAVVQGTKELARVGKMKLEIMSLENERARKFEEAGRLAHTLYKGGYEFPDNLVNVFTEIDALEAQIEAKRAELEKNKAEAAKSPTPVRTYCSQCGAVLEPGDYYCPMCGTKVK